MLVICLSSSRDALRRWKKSSVKILRKIVRPSVDRLIGVIKYEIYSDFAFIIGQLQVTEI